MTTQDSRVAFITGVAGFLGSHLAEKLLSIGWRVVGCDNLVGGYIDNVPDEVEFHELDCTDLEAMKRIMKGADLVYHCAAAAYEGLSVFSPHHVARNTVDATACVISAAISNNASRFVYCSSMARYGDIPAPFTEDMTPIPTDPYGICKLSGEQILRCLAAEHGMEFIIAVPHNIYGPRQKYDDPYRNVAAIMINLMLLGRQPIIYGDGTQRRCFSYIEDDLSVLIELATTSHPDIVNNVINVGPDEEFVPINTLAEIIADIIKFELDPVYVPSRPLEVRDAYCSAEKARACLGYRTEYTLREGLEDLVRWIQQMGPRPFDYHLGLEIVNSRTPKTWAERLF